MKKFNLRLLAFVLFLISAQNSIAATHQDGTGSEAASDETVAVGLSYTDGQGEHKNIAGNPAEPAVKYYASAIGIANTASGKYSSAFGFRNEASGEDSSAFGYNNITYGKENSAFGYRNRTVGEGSSAFGHWNRVNGMYSSAFGSQYEVTGNFSGAFGVGKVTINASGKEYKYINKGNNSYMIGNYNKIASGSNNNFILGNNVSIANGISNSVVLGNGSTVSSSNEVSVGSKGKERKITNVGDGIDTAAWKAKLGVGSGGGAPIDAYTKNEADNKFANKTDLNDYTKKDDYIDANGIDVDKWKAKLGTGASSTDIQNLRNEVYEKIDNVKDEVRDVGSLSAALAGLHPMQYDPKAPAQVMAALGHYKDRQAVAVGASYYFNDRFMMSTGVALSGEKKTKTMANIGFTLKLGKGSGVSYNETPQYVVQNEVKRLTVENQELRAKVDIQGEKIKNLEEKLNKLLKIK